MDTQEDYSEIIKSCLTDKPVQTVEEDNLKAEDYANALAKFIKNAATPVTIGIQGGWGSGKTSLITMLEHKLDEDPEHSALCVAVNAWEHSLFQYREERADVAISLLSGLSEGLAKSVKAADWLDKQAKDRIDDKNETISKAISGIKCGLMFAGKVATQMLSNMVGGGDVSNVKINNAAAAVPAMPSMASNVRELRLSLGEMVKRITYNGHPVKIVFFIDDLDRVPPATAIEILDITKNIFDMPQCVFVLAIDYEVVVKGLESKFGRKTAKNEREFRQYFDKIIQIPFTMPLGAYGDNLSQLLDSAFKDLGYTRETENNEILKRLAADAKLATGGIPRSIKRILNTLSLLQHIAGAKQRKSPEARGSIPPDMEARFIVVALHVTFPELARRLMERHDFTKWNPGELDSPWALHYQSNLPDLQLLEKDHLFNDPWEQVIYCLCAESPWLKSMARNLSRLMNNLLVALGGDEDKATEIPKEGLDRLKSILMSISVVSIDAMPESGSAFDSEDMSKHPATHYFAQLQSELQSRMDPGVIPDRTDEEAAWQDDQIVYEIKMKAPANAPSAPWNPGPIKFIWDPDDEMLSQGVAGGRYGLSQADSKRIVGNGAGDSAPEIKGRVFIYWREIPFTRNDFIKKNKIPEIVDNCVDLCEAVKVTREKLRKKAGK